MRKARLSKIAYIPQGAMNSLNPVMRIGAQMVDAVQVASARTSPGRGDRGALHARAAVGRPRSGRVPHVPARTERRHEAARVHRHRHPAQAAGDHRRRADQRPRRGDPAPGDGDHRPRPEGAQRRRDPDRPRHGSDGAVRRQGGGDVCRPAGRGRARCARCSPTPSTPMRRR